MMVQLTGWRREMMRAGVVVVRRAESGEQLQYRDQVSTRISAVRRSSQHLEDHQNMASFRMVSLNMILCVQSTFRILIMFQIVPVVLSAAVVVMAQTRNSGELG